MIVGQTAQFAIESEISEAYVHLGSLALGFFVIHIAGYAYGVRDPSATELACSFDEVVGRIARRGTHTAPFTNEPHAGLIADSVRSAIYAEEPRVSYFGLRADAFTDFIYSNDLLWAPDGDEAFDDGSHVLHFDEGEQVRLIGFKTDDAYSYDPQTLRDVWMPQETFYEVLQQWCVAFEKERVNMLKAGDV